MVAEALGRRMLPRGSVDAMRPAPEADLAAVYEAHSRYVWRCFRSLGVRDAHLDDAVQDLFVVVQRRLPEFDGRAQLRTWLYAIALRIARKYRELARREPVSLQAEHEAEARLAVDRECAAQNELLALARSALEALDDDKREVFVFARIERMSAPEIAEIIGVPLNTVYSRLRSARLAFELEVERLRAEVRNDP